MRRSSPLNFTGKLDKAAVALSGLCLVHCLLLPVLLALFPILGFSVVEHETFHQLILIVVIPTTALALATGVLRHRSAWVVALGVSGVATLIVAAFIVHAMGSASQERWITVGGGLLLAAAHTLNFRLAHAKHGNRHENTRACKRTAPVRMDPNGSDAGP